LSLEDENFFSFFVAAIKRWRQKKAKKMASVALLKQKKRDRK
jgi:hypothetical protein